MNIGRPAARRDQPLADRGVVERIAHHFVELAHESDSAASHRRREQADALHFFAGQISVSRPIATPSISRLPQTPLCGDSGTPMSQRGATKTT